MLGTGTETDPYQISTLADFAEAGALGGHLFFITEYLRIPNGEQLYTYIKKPSNINLNGARLYVNSGGGGGIVLVTYSDLPVTIRNGMVHHEWGSTRLKSGPITLEYILYRSGWSNGYRTIQYSTDASEVAPDTVLLYASYTDTSYYNVTGFKYSFGQECRGVDVHVPLAEAGSLDAFPHLEKKFWYIKGGIPYPKYTNYHAIRGYVSENGMVKSGFAVVAIDASGNRLGERTYSADDGSFELITGYWKGPTMVMAYIDAESELKQLTDYEVNDKLLPPVNNGYYLICTQAGRTAALPEQFPEGGEITIGTAVFTIHPLQAPSVHGPLLPQYTEI